MWTDECLPLVARFERWAARTPDAVALVDLDGTPVTYAELDRAAGALAAELLDRGAGAEVPVALLLDRSAAQVVAILAVLKAGGAYVPLDPGYPDQRLEFVLADSAAALLLTTADLAGRAPGAPVERLLFDEVADRAPVTAAAVHPEQTAYVIYTSGSTGTPKGVVVSQHNAARLFDATAATFHFGPDDAWTLFHSYSFDFSVWELWGALAHGGRLVLVAKEVGRAPEEFLDLVVRERVTVLNQTPSAFFQLAAEVEQRGGADLALRLVILGGESVEPARLAAWYARYPDDRPVVVNGYGVTETTVFTTFRALDAALAVPGTASLIGAPMADLRVHLLDDDLRAVPDGEVGELCIGGAGVARGYLNRPSLTAQRFVPDPDGPPGSRRYRSGDLARVAGDELEYHGRADDQVKLRGFRIELGEVEAVVAACPGVAQAAVLVRADAVGDQHIVAYVVTADGAGDLTTAVREHAAVAMPAYMVPTQVVPVPRIPLTVNGKLDKDALPALPAPVKAEPSGAVAAIWADVLGREAVDAGDHFLELGGHSLVAARIAARIRAELAVEVQVRDLYDNPLLADFARRVEALRAGGAAAPPPIRRVARVAVPAVPEGTR